MQVTKDGIERIKAANELSAVVAERGIELKKKGRVLVARCPFHEEKTASFTITPSKGLYHCFGCGVGGDVIGFVTKYDKVGFPTALERLARRAGLDIKKLMEEKPHVLPVAPLEALQPQHQLAGNGKPSAASAQEAGTETAATRALLSRVVEHYHKTFCERPDAQAYLQGRGLTDPGLWRVFKLGYADGSLLKLVPKTGELREQLVALGVITAEGRELLGGCVVFPIPDAVSGDWTTFYGRGLKVDRHCYLPGPLRGVWNYQATQSASEVVLCESVIDALSFLQAGIMSAIPLYGTNGFTPDHLDALLTSSSRRAVICLDNDEPGKQAALSLQAKLAQAGFQARIAVLPAGVKDVNELLVSRNGDGGDVLRQVLSPHPSPLPQAGEGSAPAARLRDESGAAPVPSPTAAVSPSSATSAVTRHDGQLVLVQGGVTYQARVLPVLLGRLRATIKAQAGTAFHVDTLDLYASRARSEFEKRASKALNVEPASMATALLALLVAAEREGEETKLELLASPEVPAMSEDERGEALALLKRKDLLDQVARDIDALGYVGEETLKRLLYLVAVSRKLCGSGPLSAIVLSQSGAGKSGITEVIERLTPPEDVVLLTRLTPQSLYYTEPGFLDKKLVIIEERYGSQEADYSIRVLQSRGKLIAAAPIKDPQTGNLRTKVFTVEARCAFIEATTASSVNHENGTRCFELSMDESAEQTARIHERQRRMKTEAGLKLRQEGEAIARVHWNAQRLLEPLPVVIPYAEVLTFPTAWMRTRRDHARFLNLIEVSAFLHQHQRERKDGVIVAAVADYAVAYQLAAQVLSDTLSDLRKPLREAYEHILGLSLEGDGSASRREIREALGLPDSTVRHWLSELVELEYLEVEASRGGAGKGTRYRVSARAPRRELVLGLLTPEDLERKLGGRP